MVLLSAVYADVADLRVEFEARCDRCSSLIAKAELSEGGTSKVLPSECMRYKACFVCSDTKVLELIWRAEDDPD